MGTKINQDRMWMHSSEKLMIKEMTDKGWKQEVIRRIGKDDWLLMTRPARFVKSAKSK